MLKEIKQACSTHLKDQRALLLLHCCTATNTSLPLLLKKNRNINPSNLLQPVPAAAVCCVLSWL